MGVQTVAWILTVLAAIMSISSMSTQQWAIKDKILEEEGENGTTITVPYTLHIGLKTYTVDTPNGKESGKLSSSSKWIPQNEANSYISGGNVILTFGIISLFLAVVSVIMMIMAKTGRIERKYLKWARNIAVIAGCVNMAGMLTYADNINAGYSYIAFTLAALFFFFSAATISFKEERLWHLAASIVVFIAIVFTILSMSTEYWVQDEQEIYLYDNTTQIIATTTTKLNVGLKRYSLEQTFESSYLNESSSTKESGTLKNAILPSGYDANTLDTGGNFIIGAGTLGLLIASISLFLLYKSETGLDALGPRGALTLVQYAKISGTKGRYFLMAIIGLVLTGIISMAGVLIYASELNLRYSYEFFTVASLLYFVTGSLLVGETDITAYLVSSKANSSGVPLENTPLKGGGSAVDAEDEGSDDSSQAVYSNFSGVSASVDGQSNWSSRVESR